MSYIIAIDVGLRNLGLCIFDFTTSQVVVWSKVALVHSGRYMPKNNVQYVLNFIERYDKYFTHAFAVVIERQMRCNMRIVESILQALYYDRCIIVNPRSMKVHYDISTKNYAKNKQKAVDWVQAFSSANPEIFTRGLLDEFRSYKKQDDLADALILCLYYLDTYSNHMTGTVNVATRI
ncbi:Holliday Junction Resolvase RuvC [Pleurochrysis sp. endemic virus 2]|nr:Holliday Junction Resolvase RuvC [Pleurochrysis sp. endemic virus 2]